MDESGRFSRPKIDLEEVKKTNALTPRVRKLYQRYLDSDPESDGQDSDLQLLLGELPKAVQDESDPTTDEIT